MKAELEPVAVTGFGSIHAVFDPSFVPAAEADAVMAGMEFVIGVSIEGESRAYSVPFLSGREVVNDTIGGRAIAVTW